MRRSRDCLILIMEILIPCMTVVILSREPGDFSLENAAVFVLYGFKGGGSGRDKTAPVPQCHWGKYE